MTTFDPCMVTLQELRDYIAERKGWKYSGKLWKTDTKVTRKGWKKVTRYHPIPATLDAADNALPKGWRWDYIRWAHGLCLAYTVDKPQNSFDIRTCIGVDDIKILARFRAACFAWIEEETK